MASKDSLTLTYSRSIRLILVWEIYELLSSYGLFISEGHSSVNHGLFIRNTEFLRDRFPYIDTVNACLD